MTEFFLGVDVGSSKTHAMIADENGKVVAFAQGGPGNPENTDYRDFTSLLQAVVCQALEEAGFQRNLIAGAGFGVSGYDWPSQTEPTLNAIRQLGLIAPIGLANDAIIGLLAGSERGWGVGIVAGTGCNCWGWDLDRRVGRMTGCGDWMGEAAGGMDLVVRAIRAIALNWTRRGPETTLTDAFTHLTGAKDPSDFLEGVALERYRLNQTHATLVFRAAEKGDQVALQIIEDMTAVLGDMALGVIRQLDLAGQEFDVVFIGGLFKAGVLMTSPVERIIRAEAPGAQFILLEIPPAVGGILLAMEQAGLDTQSIHPSLVRSAGVYIELSQA
ncbi:MAG TPA: BadF/BadG/BcrA/BcrD ATPase family protein [Anaerolineaceae bacterium]|nr:BadF/BadG/BcrA/BcrD ATPase family protein [Anaerolineaceae bacterium]